jgi:hypothetical protein
MRNRDRLFSGVFSTGIGYADRTVERHGDYKRLAFLSFGTLALDIEPDCPNELRSIIIEQAAEIQAKRGQQFLISFSGQTVVLGAAGAADEKILCELESIARFVRRHDSAQNVRIEGNAVVWEYDVHSANTNAWTKELARVTTLAGARDTLGY